MTWDGKPQAPKGMFRVNAKSKVGSSLSADFYDLESAKALAENFSTIPLENVIFDDTGKLICSYPIEDGTGDAQKHKEAAVSDEQETKASVKLLKLIRELIQNSEDDLDDAVLAMIQAKIEERFVIVDKNQGGISLSGR